MDTKTCTKCHNIYPMTTDYFGRRKDGQWRGECRSCAAAYSREYHAKHRDTVIERMREYHRNHLSEAHNRNARWRSEHREERLVQLRGWHQASKEERNAYSREYYREHREEILQRTYQYQEINRDRIKKVKRLYLENNRERLREQRKNNPLMTRLIQHRRRARAKSLPAFFTAAHWQEAVSYFGGTCAVCGRPAGLWHTLAADHWVPLSSPECPGTVPTNMVPLCHGIGGCNNSKHNKPAGAWLAETFGPRKARAIEARVQEFFQHMAERFPQERS